MFSKERNGFLSKQKILGSHFLQVINGQIKNQAKLPTGSCVSCNFFPNTWLGVTEESVFDAVVYLMLFLCLICFDISAQFPGHFFLFLGLCGCSKEKSQRTEENIISQCFIINEG